MVLIDAKLVGANSFANLDCQSPNMLDVLASRE